MRLDAPRLRVLFSKALERDFRPDWVQFDAWYASVELLKRIARANLLFFGRVKSNRQVSLPGQQGYQRIDPLEWSEDALRCGQLVWLKAFDWVKVFGIVRPLSDGKKEIQFHATNRLTLDDTEDAKTVLGFRWKIEQYHRELKQLTGIERCQARKQRSQRNHIGYAILAWLHLWEEAKRSARTVYQTKKVLLREYLVQQVTTPTVPVCLKTA